MSNQTNLDPTIYGRLSTQVDEGALKKARLKKKANLHEIVTGNDMLVLLRKHIEARYQLAMSLLLDDKTSPEDIPVVRAKAQIHKEYKDLLDRVDREGEQAIRELRASE